MDFAFMGGSPIANLERNLRLAKGAAIDWRAWEDEISGASGYESGLLAAYSKSFLKGNQMRFSRK
jgi:hypothetical protein